MSTDMKTQIRDYVSQLAEDQAPIDATEVSALLEPVRGLASAPAPEPLIRQQISRQQGLRWAYGIAAAVAALVLVGSVAWLSRSGTGDVINTPTTFASPTTLPPAPGEGGLVVTNVTELGQDIPSKIWGTDRIIAAGGAVWVGVDDTSFDQPAQPGALFSLNPATGEVTHEIGLPGGVIDLVADSSALWALVTDDSVVRVDLTTLQVTHSIETTLGIGGPNLRSDLIVVGDGLWIAGGDGTVARIDLEKFTVDTYSQGLDFRQGPLPVDMWVGEADGVLWGLNSHNNILVSIDLATNQVAQWPTANIGAESTAVLGPRAIWVTPPASGGKSDVVRFDLASRESTVYTVAGAGMPAIEVDGLLWMAAAAEGQLTLLDASSGEVLAVPVTDTEPNYWDLSLLATPDGSVWTSNWDDGRLYRIDAQTRQVIQTVDVEKGGGLLAFNGAIWVAAEDGTIIRAANP